MPVPHIITGRLALASSLTAAATLSGSGRGRNGETLKNAGSP